MKLVPPVTHPSDTDRELTPFLTRRVEVPDEECVIDDRIGLRTTEVIQMKLLRLLPSAPVPVSCLHVRRDTRR